MSQNVAAHWILLDGCILPVPLIQCHGIISAMCFWPSMEEFILWLFMPCYFTPKMPVLASSCFSSALISDVCFGYFGVLWALPRTGQLTTNCILCLWSTAAEAADHSLKCPWSSLMFCGDISRDCWGQIWKSPSSFSSPFKLNHHDVWLQHTLAWNCL